MPQRALENEYPEDFFELFGVVKDSSFIELEETDPNYTAQREYDALDEYQKDLNAINLAKLLSLSEIDLINGNTITHEEAKKRFESTIEKIK
jgi:hypothetical protein